MTTPQAELGQAWSPISRRDVPSDTVALAEWVIGRHLVRDIGRSRMIGRIVEAEAYPPNDPASHAFRGPTRRNKSMYLPRGHAYVYFIYGRYFMLNVSSEDAGTGAGVLIRALEPVNGLARMRKNRPGAIDGNLLRGPGCLAAALEIDLALDGIDMCRRGPLWLSPGPGAGLTITRSKRIGIRRNAHALWRFHAEGSPYVSR
jgi:DNA-3-methyladenine glycosylase